jgi:CCR4-NOT transcriptional regulation complex NOT5 subunit
MNPTEYLAFELEAEKVRLNAKLSNLAERMIAAKKEKEKDTVFLINETIRKLEAQIEAIDAELVRRNNK